MYVKKINTSGIWYRVGYSVVCVAIGWYLHAKMTPDFSAMMFNNEPPYVLVQGLQKADVSAKKKYIAQIEAVNSVDIVPQVSGYLEDVLFEDGAFVHQGDEIFLIEQRKYRADLKAAEAALKQISADYKRIKSLHEKKFVSDKELDLAQSNLEKAEASVDVARLNMEYTRIKSPISGYIGKVLVSKGNLVSPSTPRLARVVQTQPIRVAFSVTDKERSAFMRQTKEAQNVLVDIVMPNGKIETKTVQNLFFGNEVNAETATVPVYIDLQNDENLLVPGNYVDILIRFNQAKEAVLVPQVALSADVNGSYVMTVNADGIVEQKYLQLGDVVDDKQVVLSGLNGDEKVIIQGLQKVRSGLKVNPTEVETSSVEAE
jgi:RND family efflux transporter MFP subunit